MATKLVRILSWTVWVFFAVLFISDVAYAWGPGVHVDTSRFVLENLMLLSPLIRKLIHSHPFAFIYGSVSPDMVLGKRFMKAEHNNHNWSFGFNLLESAETERQKSFALGYLAHLAADTVAHNQFVPDRLITDYGKRRRGHMSQELIFDSMMADDVWTIARIASRRPFRECDTLLVKRLTGTPLPRNMNRRLFKSGMMLVKYGGWARVVKHVRRRAKHDMDDDAMQPYLDAIRKATIDILNDHQSAECLLHEPTGGDVLPEAESLKVSLRKLAKTKQHEEEEYDRLVGVFRDWRMNTLFPADISGPMTGEEAEAILADTGV